MEFTERVTIEAALRKAKELGEAHFTHITIINVLTGVEITDLEALIPDDTIVPVTTPSANSAG